MSLLGSCLLVTVSIYQEVIKYTNRLGRFTV